MSAAAFDISNFDDSEESYAKSFEMWEMMDEKVHQSAENSYINDLVRNLGYICCKKTKQGLNTKKW